MKPKPGTGDRYVIIMAGGRGERIFLLRGCNIVFIGLTESRNRTDRDCPAERY